MGELGAELGELRGELNARPLVLTALAFALALSTAFVAWHFVFCGLVLAAASSWRNAGLIVLAVVAGALLRVDSTPERILEDQRVGGEFRVISVPVRSYEDEVVEVRNGRLTLTMTLPPGSQIGLGDRLRVEGLARPLTRPDYRVNGIGGMLRPEQITVLSAGPGIWKSAAGMRRSFDAFLDRHAPPRAGALLNALCFSMTAELPADTKDALVRSGTMHIAATSGMHVVIVGWALLLAFSRIPMPRWLQLLLVALALVLYAGAAGLRPSIIRAVLMMLVWAAAPFVGRERDGLSALAAGAIGYLLWRPDGVVDVGFLLSISAVAGLVLYAPRFESPPEGALARLGYGIKNLALVSLTAQLAVLPISAYVFGQVSVISLAANLLVVPLLGVVTVSVLAAWMIAPVWLAGGTGLLSWVAVPLTGWLLAVIHTLGLPSWAAVSVPPFSPYWIPVLYLAGLLAWRPRVRPA